jgi:4-amino-4-deoxy-L-arabinose transferase-like glycosyltransferase
MHADSPDVMHGTPPSTVAPRRSARLLERVRTLSVSHAAGALIAIGIVLRLVRFLHYRSLWLDEATLALNVMSRPYSRLVTSLDFAQGAPAGFLALEKLSISLFGDSERAFRLVPFLAGIASLYVFWRVALRFLDRYAALLALAFFSFMECFVYYGAETRPYELDVLATLVLLLLFDRVLEKRTLGRFAAFAAAGIVAPWFSFGSLFVLAGTGATLFVFAIVRHDRRMALLTAGAAAAWVVSFAIEYHQLVQHLSHLAGVVAGVNSETSSLVKGLYILFSEPGALPRTLIALLNLLVVIGAVALARKSWPSLMALLTTLLAAFVVGAMHKYPASGRWILYLVPLAVLLLAEGIVTLVRSTKAPTRLVVLVGAGVLLAVVAAQTARNAVRLPTEFPGTPAVSEPAKQLINGIGTAWRPGDVLYVSRSSEFAFRYYLTCKDCNPRAAHERALWPFTPKAGPNQDSAAFTPGKPSLVLGTSGVDLNLIQHDFAKLHGRRRVWFLFTDEDGVDLSTVELLLQHYGRELRAIHAGASEALLFDLR